MPIETLRRALQLRQPMRAPQLPASVAIGLALPAGGLGIVFIGMDLQLLGLLAWTAAIATIGFVLKRLYACITIAAMAAGGLLLWQLLLGDSVILNFSERMVLALITLLAAVVGQLLAADLKQREAIRTGQLQRDLLASTIESIFASSQDCIKLLATDGSVLAINARGLALIGAERIEQVVGQNWFSFWSAEQQKALAASWQTLLTQGSAEFDGACRILTGQRRNWQNRFTLVNTPAQSQAYIICHSYDITEGFTLQQRLAATTAHLQELFTHIDDAAFTLTDDGLVSALNPCAERLCMRLGLPASIVGQPFDVALHIAPGEPTALAIRRALERQTVERCEYFHAAQQLWLSLVAMPFAGGIDIVARDITVLKAARRQAAEQQARRELSHEIADFADWSFDYEHGSVQFSERAITLLELEGSTPSDYKKHLLEKLEPRDRMALVQAIVNVSAATPAIDLTLRLPRESAASKHLRWVGRLVLDERGNPARMLGAIQDVGAHLNAHHMLETAATKERMLHALAEHLPEVFWTYDVAAGAYTYISPAFETLYGVPAPRVSGNYWTLIDYVHPDDRQRVHEAMRDALDGSVKVDIEYRMVDARGGVHWLSSNCVTLQNDVNRAAYVVGITRDITAGKQQEQKTESAGDKTVGDKSVDDKSAGDKSTGEFKLRAAKK